MSAAMNKTIEIVTKALNIFATEDKGKEVDPTDVQLWIGTKDEEKCTPYFWVCKNGVPHMRVRKIEGPIGQEETAEVTWDQLRGVKFDVLGRPYIMPTAYSFLSATIKRYALALDTDPRNVGIQIIGFMQEREGKDAKLVPVPFLYDLSDENQKGYQLSWENDIFGDESELQALKDTDVGGGGSNNSETTTGYLKSVPPEFEITEDPQNPELPIKGSEPATSNHQPADQETDIRN